MKKLFTIILAALCLVSCRLDGPHASSVANRDGLISFAQSNIHHVAIPYSDFQYLYCVHLYRNYTGSDIDLQWFARFGKCRTTGNIVIMENGPKYAIRTNGLDFDQVGASYTVNGYTFLCTEAGASPVWSVLSDETTAELKVSGQSASHLDCEWKGVSLVQDSKTERYSYTFSMLKPWGFVNSPSGSWFDSYFDNTADYPVGEYRLSIEVDGVETDWVETSLNGTSPDTYKTSRDDQKK